MKCIHNVPLEHTCLQCRKIVLEQRVLNREPVKDTPQEIRSVAYEITALLIVVVLVVIAAVELLQWVFP